jgi:transcriptional regulator with XRE-family HTH domain
MEMQVKAELIRSERERRAWSQAHLASVAGLGLRTVQRIEASGNASYESVAAIAAVLSMSVAELAADTPATPSRAPRRHWLPHKIHMRRIVAGTMAAFLISGGIFAIRSAAAAPLQVEFGVLLNGDEPFMGGRLPGSKGGFGRGDLVVKIKSSLLEDGSVLLRARVYECDGEEEHDTSLRLLSDSDLTTAVGTTAEIRLTSVESGHDYTIRLTPHLT